MILLGIDYGTKRIGLAITDELEIIASPLKTVPNDPAGLDELRKIVSERRVELVVVGLPLNMDGSLGPAGKAAEAFAEKLRAELAAPVETFDERLTTVQAERSMLMHDISRAKRAGRRDEMAAQIMLQSCVDARKRMKR
ncbi:MAG TPA: Holliday junction resolvase RuvX [Planctomycetota bacterium]|nr:Holliday junction resolvase RuvX [Planctomycetota bacterium]